MLGKRAAGLAVRPSVEIAPATVDPADADTEVGEEWPPGLEGDSIAVDVPHLRSRLEDTEDGGLTGATSANPGRITARRVCPTGHGAGIVWPGEARTIHIIPRRRRIRQCQPFTWTTATLETRRRWKSSRDIVYPYLSVAKALVDGSMQRLFPRKGL